MFVIQNWHSLYGQALLETDWAKLRVRIAKAERAILARFLELCLSPTLPEEDLDLQNAADVLLQLRQVNVLASTQQQFVA